MDTAAAAAVRPGAPDVTQSLGYLTASPVSHRTKYSNGKYSKPRERWHWRLETDHGFRYVGEGPNMDGWDTKVEALAAGIQVMTAFFGMAVTSKWATSPLWLPIETWEAMDPRPMQVLGAEGAAVGEMCWQGDDEGWYWAGNHPTDVHGGRIYPTHWTPMPASPFRPPQPGEQK